MAQELSKKGRLTSPPGVLYVDNEALEVIPGSGLHRSPKVWGDRMTEKKTMARSKFIGVDNMSLQDIDQDSELIPLLTPEDEKEMNDEELPETLPILPLRNTVLFPGVSSRLLREGIPPYI